MASIDRIDWHSGGNYPKNLPPENGGTHIGMFLTWVIMNDFIGEIHREDAPEEIQKVLKREITGRDFLIEICDGKFWNEDLNEEGVEFTTYYYRIDPKEKFKNYFDDYIDVLARHANSIYEVENSWENYDKIKIVIDERFKEWRSANR